MGQRRRSTKVALALCVAGLWAGCTPAPSPPRVDGGASGAPVLEVWTCLAASADRVCTPTVNDTGLELQTFRPGDCVYATLEIRNSGDGALVVEAPELTGSPAEAFAWVGDAPGAFTLGASAPGQPTARSLQLRYCGGQPPPCAPESGTVLLRSNDVVSPERQVPLYGNTHGPGQCYCNPSQLEAAPGAPIPLSINCSMCDVRYHWTLLRGPTSAHVVIADPDAQTTTASADQSTTASDPYVFRGTAADHYGITGYCDMTVFAVPRDALHIQLVWSTDADLDLHLLNPMGVAAPPNAAVGWFSSPNDCYYANRTPEWGVAGNTSDNPRLNPDATHGPGPENINLPRPAAGRYRIGVHDFCEPDGGTSATVRVFCNGQLAQEFGPRALAGSAFWEVADVQWPGCTVSEIGTLFESGRSCIRRPDGGP